MVTCWWDKRIGGEERFGGNDGPEFSSRAFQEIRQKWKIRERVIPPGGPYWNGFVESFHEKEKGEWLFREIFESFEKVSQEYATCLIKNLFESPFVAPFKIYLKVFNCISSNLI